MPEEGIEYDTLDVASFFENANRVPVSNYKFRKNYAFIRAGGGICGVAPFQSCFCLSGPCLPVAFDDE